MAKRLELLIQDGPRKGERVVVPDHGLRVGRASSNDLPIADEELSRNHCWIQTEGETGLTIMDLASANGTYVNGVSLESDARSLHAGDEVVMGGTRMTIVGEAPIPVAPLVTPGTTLPPAEAGNVDLGLDSPAQVAGEGEGAPAAKAKRSPLASALWALSVLLVLSAIVIVLLNPFGAEPAKPQMKAVGAVARTEKGAGLISLTYEKVEADANHIFRYQMSIDSAGILKVVSDDMPQENRHIDRSKQLSEDVLTSLMTNFDSQEWKDLDSEYMGASARSENALKRAAIRLVRRGEIKEVLVENVLEPQAFAKIRDLLETFSRNELGIWAIQYSREQLLALCADAEKRGDAKWAERDVEYGNLNDTVKAYREAVVHLETVDPKPEGYAELRRKCDRAVEELDKRYREQRFLADKAINMSEWEEAREQLQILLALVPDKGDKRHQEANSKLIDVEQRMKRERKGGVR